MISTISMVAMRGDSDVRRRLGFVACAVLLSLVPLTTTTPHDRVLVLATIGSCFAFGEVIAVALEPKRKSVLMRLGVLIVLIIHDVLSPTASVLLAANFDRLRVSLHTPNLLLASLLSPSREARGLNRPNFSWVLHAEPASDLQIRRVDARTLELYDPSGWLRGPDSMLMRSATEPFQTWTGEDFELWP